MAVMLTAKDLVVDYPTKTVLNGVSLGIDAAQRIGIVGANGGGKSTLLRVLAGLQEPDSGQVIANGSPTIGVLGQSDAFDNDQTVDQVLSLGGRHTSAYTWQADRAAREIVDALIGDIPTSKTVGTLSGGQRRRVDLAQLLIGDWDILMLDEPTNHLDLHAINWLAQHVKRRWPRGNGALLVVTHDRWFLDEVCSNMWEVHEGNVLPFEGGYSAYTYQRLERARLDELARQKRENQLRKELAWLSRGAQARRSKPKFHLEAAQALIADVPEVRNPLELKAMAVARLGKQVYELNDVCIDRGGKRLLSDMTWSIGPGQRIGILGENGAGKTTLLNLFAERIKPTLGHMKVGRTVKSAMLTQQLEELAPIEDDVVRVVCSRYKTYYQVEGKKLSPTRLLERLGFTHDELNVRVKDLSGGQRRRLQLLLILLEEPNVLILDEPGNDLDTDMMAVTEDLLDSWPGTLFVVSHDRYFIERVTDDQYAIVDTRIRHMPGGVDEYLALVGQQGAKDQPGQSRSSGKQADSQDAGQPADAMSNAQRQELRKQIARAERMMQTQEQRVAQAQQDLDSCDPFDYEALGKAQAALDEAKERLASLEDEWLELSEQMS